MAAPFRVRGPFAVRYAPFTNATMWPIAATARAKKISIMSRQGTSLGGPSGCAGRAPSQPQTTHARTATPASMAVTQRLTSAFRGRHTTHGQALVCAGPVRSLTISLA